MIDIPLDAPVECTDGHAGHSTHVIVNPTTRKITRLAVESKRFASSDSESKQRLVPIDRVIGTNPNQIQLNCTKAELNSMEPFTEVHYVTNKEPFLKPYDPQRSFLCPFVTAQEAHHTRVETERIPAGELAVRRGAQVEASDIYIDKVDELLVDPSNDTVTHFILVKGHFWGKKKLSFLYRRSIGCMRIEFISNLREKRLRHCHPFL